MYRILLQTQAASLNRPAVYQYLMDKNIVWETEDSKEALERYEAELDNYKKSVMTLVRIVTVDLNPSAEGCICPDDCVICKPGQTPVDPEETEDPEEPTDPEETEDPEVTD